MSVVSLPDMKLHLGMKENDNDGGLTEAMAAAEAIVGTRLGGPLTVGASFTVRVPGGTQLVLPGPIGAVTAITTPDGQTLNLSTVTLNKPAGLAYFTDDLTTFSNDVYDVTMTLGWTTVPDDLIWGLKECVREIWAARRVTGQAPPANSTGWQQWVDPYRFVRVSAA